MPEKQNSASMLVSQIKVIAVLVIALWSLEIVDFLGGHWLDNFGIRPRTTAQCGPPSEVERRIWIGSSSTRSKVIAMLTKSLPSCREAQIPIEARAPDKPA